MSVKAGIYKCHAISADLINSAEKKTPGVSVVLKVDETGEMLDWTGWLTDGTKAKTAESLALMGFDGTDLTTVTRNEVIAVVEDEEWTDKKGNVHTTPRVRWINDPARGGAKFAEMDPAQKQQMLGDLRGLVLSLKKPDASFNFGANKKVF